MVATLAENGVLSHHLKYEAGGEKIFRAKVLCVLTKTRVRLLRAHKPRSFSDLTSVSVPLDLSFLFGQLACELCVLKLGDGLVLQVYGEVCRRLADDQLCGGLVVCSHGGVLALVCQRAVFDGQCVLVFVHSVHNAFVEGDFLAALHPLQGGIGPVDLAGEAHSLLLLSVDVFQRNDDPQTLL